MKKFFYFLIILILVSILNPVINAQDVNYISRQTLINKLNLNNNIHIIDKLSADINHDKVNDQIFLIGEKPGGDSSHFYAPIEVVVYDIFNKEFFTAGYKTFGGYEPKIALYDFTNDKTKDIFIEANTGGSGGIYNHMILSFIQNELKVIFDNNDNKGITVSGNYIDNFKAKLYIKELNNEINLNLSFNKSKYIEENIYNNEGKLLKEISPYVYPYSKLIPIDYDLDGSFELKGNQKLVGAYGADQIGSFDTILKYDNGWNVKQIEISTFLKKYDISSEMKDQYNYDIKRNAVTSGIKEIYYPEIIDLPKEVNSIYINSQLKRIVDPFFNKKEELYINYEITKQTDKLLSVVYQGYQRYENGEYELLYSFNYDLKNNRKLTTKNILKKGNNIKDTVNKIIKKSIDDQKLKEEFPGIAEWMGMYITDKNLVFYYLKNDFVAKHTKIYVPLKDIVDYLSLDIEYDREETEIFFIEVD